MESLDHSTALMENFFEKLYNSDNSDVTLVVGDTKFAVHRLILSTHSAHFRKVFRENNASEIVIDAPTFAFEQILKYLYSGTLDLHHDMYDLIEILELAEQYNLVDLEETLTEVLTDMVSQNNLVELIKAGTTINSPKLIQICVEVMNQHSNNFLSSDFLQLSETEITVIFLHEDMILPNLKKFTKISDWIKEHPQCSMATRNKLLHSVNLKMLTNHQLQNIVMPTKLFDNKELLKIMDERSFKSPKVVKSHQNVFTTPQKRSHVQVHQSPVALWKKHEDDPEPGYFVDDFCVCGKERISGVELCKNCTRPEDGAECESTTESNRYTRAWLTSFSSSSASSVGSK